MKSKTNLFNKMKRKLLSMFLLSFVFLSCGKESNYPPLEPVKETQYLKNAKSFSDVFMLTDSLELKTSDSTILQMPRDIKIKNGKIVLFDGMNDNKIIVFDSLGNQTAVIHKKGQGPGEYNHIHEMDMDGNYIYIIDHSQRKIILYNYDGIFINSFKVRSFYTIMNVNNGKLFLKRQIGLDLKYDKTITDVYETSGKYVDSIVIPISHKTTRYKSMMDIKYKLVIDNNNLIVGCSEDNLLYNYDMQNKKLRYKTNYLPKWVKMIDYSTEDKGKPARDRISKNTIMSNMILYKNIFILQFNEFPINNYNFVLYDANGNYLTDFKVNEHNYRCYDSRLYGWNWTGNADKKNKEIIYSLKLKIYEMKQGN